MTSQPASVPNPPRSHRLARALIAACMSLPVASLHGDEPAWPEDDPGIDVHSVNEGVLRFLADPPGEPVHHHHNRMEIVASSLVDGWVRLDQCHTHLDPVPDTQIVYNPDRIRGLEITSFSDIASARVEGHTVQMKEIRRGARICVHAETRALRSIDGGRFVLTNGPFMRQFLDGYYPMHVTMEIRLTPGCLTLREFDPRPQPGFRVTREADAVHVDAWFEGRLTTNFEFERPARPSAGTGGC